MENKHNQDTNPSPGETDRTERILNEALRCPACLEIVRCPPLIGCSNGHYLCGLCLTKVKCCPLCRAKNLNVHNRPLEEYLENQIKEGKIFDCKNKSEGCPVRKPYHELLTHEKRCDLRTVSCPSEIYSKCTWQGNYKELVNHLKQGNCSVLVNLEDTLQARHAYPEISNLPNIFQSNQRTAWRPTCYIRENQVFAYIYIRREINNEWFLTCHTFADQETIEQINVKCTLQSTPLPHGNPAGADMMDFVAPQDLRPTITNIHHNAVRITCPRPATLQLTINGKGEAGIQRNEPHQGFCFISVSSQKTFNPLQTTEGEVSFQYKGKMLPAGISAEEMKQSGRFLCLKDAQLKSLKRKNILYHLNIEFGALVHLKYDLPANLGQQQTGKPNPLTPAKRKAEHTPTDQDRPTEDEEPQEKTPKPTPVSDRTLVVSKILIPWKRSGSSQTKGHVPTKEETELLAAPMTSIIPIYPAAQFPNKSILSSIRDSHTSLHGKI